ncbi:hypothetical protein ACFYWU_41820 [Streptomyces chrestomyceticus]|uniref:hypothetical protein n=1 Tax=Streptomyces chrestomyceticus TaxID=68185 RepID=UPI00369ADB09
MEAEEAEEAQRDQGLGQGAFGGIQGGKGVVQAALVDVLLDVDEIRGYCRAH